MRGYRKLKLVKDGEPSTFEKLLKGRKLYKRNPNAIAMDDYNRDFELFTLPATSIHDADVVSSEVDYKAWWGDTAQYHQPVLDLDVDHVYVDSTTPGHGHLYFNLPEPLSESRYFRLLDVLADCGIIEEGYAKVSKRKGYTAARLPWIKKEDGE